MERATARLRKTFQYKADDDDDSDDSLPEAIDEEEQASLIQTLQTRNTVSNTRYRIFFLFLPLLCTIFYSRPLLLLLSHRSSFAEARAGGEPQQRQLLLRSVLSITSLGVSAYVLWFLRRPPLLELPLPLGLLEKWTGGADRKQTGYRAGRQRPRQGAGGTERIEKGPLELYLPLLNALLTALLAVTGFVKPRGSGEAEEGIWFALLPGLVYGVVVAAAEIMGGADEAVGQLEGLRYGYKGA